MGIGEEALSAFLTPEGWSLKPAALAHFGKRADASSARKALLDVDLSRVGIGCLPSWAREDDGTSGGELTGPMVLQLVRATDISRPQRRPAASAASAAARADASGGPPRMLRLELTDGDAVVVGVEHAPLLSLPSDASLAPGAKLALAPDARVERRRGLLLFRGDQLRPIGGRVPELAEAWEQRRAFETSGAGSEAEAMKLSGAPEFRSFDAKEAAQMAREAAAAKDRAHRAATAAAAEALGAASATASTAASASASAPASGRTAPGVSTDAAADANGPAAFVPRRRPALPPTRAQRAAAAAAGVPLPAPGQPLDPPRLISSDSDASAEPDPAPAFVPRQRPALPPRRGAAAPVAPVAPVASGAPPGFEPATASAPPSAQTQTPAPAAIALDRDAQRSRLLDRMSAEARASALDDPGGRGRRGDGGRSGRGGRGGRGRGGDRGDREEPGDRRVTFEQHEARRGARGTEADDEALARRLQRELDLEHRGDGSDDASAALAASLFRFDAREVVGEDDKGRRGGRGGGGRGRGRGRR